MDEQAESEPPSRPPSQDDRTTRALVVDVTDPSSRLNPSVLVELRRQAEAAARWLNAHGEVRVRLVEDREMSAAHERYAGVAGTTDVLTFDLREPGAPANLFDVDILACVDEARRQGDLRRHGAERELLLYIVHGLLHCLGHDDHDPAAYARMHALEDRVLEAIGVGRVFAAPAAGGQEVVA